MVKRLLKSILIFLLISIGWDAYGQNPRILTTGTTFTVPANTKAMKVEAWGGGGSGGQNSGGGGGAGSYSRSSIPGPFAGSYPYIIGAGGTGNTNPNRIGGTTSFGTGPILVSATGGSFGINNGAGGAGGSNATNIGNENTTSGGAGGSGSGNSGGAGGNSPNGGTGGAGGANTNNTGAVGTPPGGGGGGAGKNSNTNASGGSGQIRISYIALTSATNTDAQTVCSGNAITSIIYSIPTGSPTANVTNLPSGVTSTHNSAAGTITITGNPTNSSTYTLSVTTSYGVSLSTSGSISINPIPTLSSSLTPAAICSNSAFTYTPTSATAGTTFTWTRAAVAGISNAAVTTAQSANPNETLVNTTANPVNVVYAYTITANGCSNTQNVTVTVNPTPTLSSTLTPPAICSNSAFTYTPTSASAGSTFTWTRAAVTGISNAAVTTAQSANPNETLVNTTANPVNVVYAYTITANGCSNTQNVTVTVNPIPTLSSSLTPAAICSNSAFTYTPTSATAGSTFTWTRAAVAGISNAAVITAQSANPNETLVNTTANPVNVVYAYTITANGCSNTQNVTVTVNPTPTLSSTLTLETCNNASFTYTPTSATSGSTFTWTRAAVTGISNPAVTTPQTSNPNETLINTTGNPIDVIYAYTITANGCTNTQNITVTVNPITAITTQPDNTGGSVCFGDGFSPISVSAVGGNLTYQWYSNPINSNSGGSVVMGATSPSFTPPSTPEGSMYYYVVVTGACGSETSNVTGEYDVAPPITTIIQSPSLTDQYSCLNGTFSPISLIADGAGTLSYQWYSNTTNTNSGGTLISGATNSSYTPPATSVGTLYYYATAKSDCGTVPTAVSGAFTVYAPPTVTNPATASICSSESPNISLTASVPSNFSWTIGTITGGITGASAGSGATINQTLTNPSNTTAGTVEYLVTPTSITGSCTGTPYTITVTVNPTPTVTNSATAITCSGTGPNISLTASVPSSFSWTIGTITGAITGASAGSGATINQTLTNPSNTTAGTVQYIVTPTSTTGSCPGAPYTITVTVNPQPVVTNSTLTQTICSGGSTTAVTLTSGIAGTTFTWTASATAGVSGYTASGSGPIPVETISTTGTTQGTVTYVITPTANGCPGPTKNYTVLVNPQPTVTNSSLSQTICSGGSTTAVTPTSGVAGTTFTWTATATAGVSGFTPSGTGPIPVQTISTTGTTQGTVTYVITPTANGCTGPTKNYTVLVNPLATVSAPSVAFPSVCINSPTLTPFTQTTTGVTGIDQPGVPGVNGLPPGISASFSGNTITFSGTATTTGLYTYSIPVTSGTCTTGLAVTGTIDVTPVYDITAVSSVSATTIGGSASVTFYGDPTKMLNGTYQLYYQIKQGSGSFSAPIAVTATVNNGKGTFLTNSINSNTDTYTVQILSIKKSTDVCNITLPSPPTTYFGVCSAVFTSGTNTFHVPANVYSITIEVYGGGGGGANSGAGGGAYSIRTNIPVTPGEPLAVITGAGGARNGNNNGGVSYVTRDSNIANQLANSLVYANGGNSGSNSNTNKGAGGTFDTRYSGSNGTTVTGNPGGAGGGPLGGLGGANGADGYSPGGGGGKANGQGGDGGNGLVVISYSCPDADNTDCIKIIDDGTKSGSTVIEFTGSCEWEAPEGLAEFTVYVGSGGGGGGSGFGSGGGGSGALIRQSFATTNPYGLPAGTSFPIIAGKGGVGASAPNTSGANGNSSTFSGIIDGNPVNIVVQGGGGGGSQSSIAGANGSSGGGGGARPNPSGTFGAGGNSIPITYSGTNVTLYQGNTGGNGDFSSSQNAIAGGGGGGLIPFVPADRPNGKAAGNGQGEGGDGGKGISLTLGDSIRYFGAGGGGIGEYFNGTEKVGFGGSAAGVKIGGDGNLANPSAVGGAGRDKTGSGGGAGYGSGGKGGDGVVYIVFINQRILQVEYQSFEAKFNADERTGELHWITSKEWENSHFEIERAVNNPNGWEKIGEVKGQGYSESPTEYAFIDQTLPTTGGNVFYRLKQVDYDESFSYSVTRSIQVPGLKGKTNWIIYPNPSENRTSVVVGLLNTAKYNDEPIIIRISDVRGVVQTYTAATLEEVNTAVNSYLENAISGMYIVQFIWGDHSEQIKIVRK